MAILDILQYPNPRLRIKAAPVTVIDSALRCIIDDMYETMYASKGIGLAATQVDIHQRLFTIDLSETHDQGMCIINPIITHQEGTQHESEGCLSVGGGAYEKIERAMKVVVQGIDLEEKPIELSLEGLAAACIQHEMDHLNGILFIDHVSRLKQTRIRAKIEKLARREK